MNGELLFQLMIYSAPVFSAMVCCIVVLLCYRDREKHTGALIMKLLIFYYLLIIVNWVSILFYIYKPHIFVHIIPITYLSFLWVLVVFYHFVYTITATGKYESFPFIHYAVPLIIFLGMAIWSLFVPYDAQLYIVENRGTHVGEYKWYSMFFTSKLLIRLVYSIIYVILGLRRLLRYRKTVIDYSADESRSSMRWLYLLFFLSVSIFLGPFMAVFAANEKIITFVLPALPVFFLVVQHVVLCYNMIMGNYVIMYPPVSDEETGQQNEYAQRNITKKWFESYMQEKKPYLDPKLKISDLTPHFFTNRSYLSSFINVSYGINFSRYINRLRLKELERLRKDPQYSGCDELELVTKAGFVNYRGYLRVKKQEEESGQKLNK